MTRKDRLRFFIVPLALIAETGAWVLPTGAADYYVRPPGTTATDASPYDTWDTAATQIQWAVDVAMTNLPSTVWVTNGAYSVSNQIAITNSVTLRSVNGYSNTLVYASWPVYTTRVFYIVNTGTLDGFSISNGHLYLMPGGGVLASNKVTVQNCNITHNAISNHNGAGIYLHDSTIRDSYVVRNGITPYGGFAGAGVYLNAASVIDTCYVLHNTGPAGAGIYVNGTGSKLLNCSVISNSNTGGYGGGVNAGNNLVSNCVIARNWGQYGGGLVASGLTIDCLISNNSGGRYGGGMQGAGTVLNCTFVGNSVGTTVEPGGGGAYFDGLLLSNCVFAGNTGPAGAGLVLPGAYSASVRVDSCRISNNLTTGSTGPGGAGLRIMSYGQVRNTLIHHNTNMSSAGYGGGVRLDNASGNQSRPPHGLINCTIVDNYSTNDGGGIALANMSNNVVNCVVAGNSSHSGNYPNVYFVDNPAANRNNISNSCVTAADPSLVDPAMGNITNDPVLSAFGNYRLEAASPCINAGTNQAWMTNSFDLDRQARVRYGTVDMGAYERVHEATIYNFH